MREIFYLLSIFLFIFGVLMLRQKLFSALSNTVATAKPFLLRRSLIVPKQTIRHQLQQFRSNYFEWRGQQFHFIDEGVGVPILMIHGFGGSHYNFEKLSSLLKNDFRVIRIDLPGFGLSDFPNQDPDLVNMYRTFISAFVENLRLADFYIMGCSLGGYLSWLYTLDHPEKLKGLVLLNSFGYDVKQIRKRVLRVARFRIAKPFFQKGIPPALLRKSLSRGYENPAIIDDAFFFRSEQFFNTEGNIDAFLKLTTYSNFPPQSLIKNIDAPTLIFWGKQDKLIPVEYAFRFHQDIKNSTLVLLDNCGHVSMTEQPEKVRLAFTDWANSLSKK